MKEDDTEQSNKWHINLKYTQIKKYVNINKQTSKQKTAK